MPCASGCHLTCRSLPPVPFASGCHLTHGSLPLHSPGQCDVLDLCPHCTVLMWYFLLLSLLLFSSLLGESSHSVFILPFTVSVVKLAQRGDTEFKRVQGLRLAGNVTISCLMRRSYGTELTPPIPRPLLMSARATCTPSMEGWTFDKGDIWTPLSSHD